MITKEQIEDWLKDNCSYLLGTQYEKVIFNCIEDLAPKWVSVDKSYPEKLDIVLITDGENYDTVMYFHDAYLGTPFVRKPTHWISISPPLR